MLLNCDLGESFGSWDMGLDAAVMPHVHQANIACGFHASDPLTMDRTVQLAKSHGVTIGAHPGYPDLVGFGRRSMACSVDEVIALVTYQVGALQAICQRHDVDLTYVKPHGALYNDMMLDDGLFESILRALAGLDNLSLMLMASMRNDYYRSLADNYGIPLLFEFFADRAYGDDCSLVHRSKQGAVLDNADDILDRARYLLDKGEVITTSGRSVPLSVDTICVHGDNPASVAVAERLRQLIDITVGS